MEQIKTPTTEQLVEAINSSKHFEATFDKFTKNSDMVYIHYNSGCTAFNTDEVILLDSEGATVRITFKDSAITLFKEVENIVTSI